MAKEIEIMKLGLNFLGITLNYNEDKKQISIYDNSKLVYEGPFEYNKESKNGLQYLTTFHNDNDELISYFYEETKGNHVFTVGDFLKNGMALSIKVNKTNNEIESINVKNINIDEQFANSEFEIYNNSIKIKLNESLQPNHRFDDKEIVFICDLSPNKQINLVYKKIFSNYRSFIARTIQVSDNSVNSTFLQPVKKSEKEVNQFLKEVLSHEEIKELFNYILNVYSKTISSELSDFILNQFYISNLIINGELRSEETDNYINRIHLEGVSIKTQEEKTNKKILMI